MAGVAPLAMMRPFANVKVVAIHVRRFHYFAMGRRCARQAFVGTERAAINEGLVVCGHFSMLEEGLEPPTRI